MHSRILFKYASFLGKMKLPRGSGSISNLSTKWTTFRNISWPAVSVMPALEQSIATSHALDLVDLCPCFVEMISSIAINQPRSANASTMCIIMEDTSTHKSDIIMEDTSNHKSDMYNYGSSVNNITQISLDQCKPIVAGQFEEVANVLSDKYSNASVRI